MRSRYACASVQQASSGRGVAAGTGGSLRPAAAFFILEAGFPSRTIGQSDSIHLDRLRRNVCGGAATSGIEVIHMFGFLRSSHTAQPGESPDPDPHQVLCFDPDRIVRAIRFHLLDGAGTPAVSAESCAESLARISAAGQRLTIRRARWAAMTDSERLHWLLERSRTAVRLRPDGVAVLWSSP